MRYVGPRVYNVGIDANIQWQWGADPIKVRLSDVQPQCQLNAFICMAMVCR
jgi:hypothetical protein